MFSMKDQTRTLQAMVSVAATWLFFCNLKAANGWVWPCTQIYLHTRAAACQLLVYKVTSVLANNLGLIDLASGDLKMNFRASRMGIVLTICFEMFKCRKGVKSSVPSAIGSVGSMLDNTEMGCQPCLCAEHVPWGLWAVLGSLVSLLPSSNSLVAANTQHAPGLLKNKLRRKSKSLFFFFTVWRI